MVDEEVAIRMYFTGVVWILSCDTRIHLQRNKAHKRRKTLERATSSSTTPWSPCLAAARSRSGSNTPPACYSLPSRRFATRWGRLNRPINCNLFVFLHFAWRIAKLFLERKAERIHRGISEHSRNLADGKIL